MKSFTHLLLACFVVFSAASMSACCGGEGLSVTPAELSAEDEKKFDDYVGEWSGENTKLSIGKDKMVHYEKTGGMSKKLDAPVMAFKPGKELEVGALGITTKFKINKAPKKGKDGKWTMTVDGVELTR